MAVKQIAGSILVTGGAGYIGSMLVELLLCRGYSVRVLDSLLFGSNALAPFLDSDRFELIEGDIRDEKSVAKAFEKIQAVIHLAAIVGEPACNRDEQLAISTNRDGSQLLCEAAIDRKINRFLFASTCSNYGKMKESDAPVDETAELQPLSTYSITKVGFEQYLLAGRAAGFHPTCLRFATAFGLSHRPRFDLTVNEFTRELAMGRELDVYGELFWRPYCHVADLANACRMVLEAPVESVSHQAFNVGDNSQNFQKASLIDLIDNELPGSKQKVRFIQKEHDLRDYRVSFNKIRERLDFRISKKVPDGIHEIADVILNGRLTDPDNPLYCNV
ncbi:MAG: NAD(P)-dependent oxidoreductase [bacterium]|nr:NAD(P)-dependent oxidoreductase [bacterium]